MQLIIIIFWLGPALVTQAAQPAGWRGITPLRSTRADVERKLGQPIKPDAATYDTPHERVTVSYSRGPCQKGVPGWNVAADTVISLTVAPKKRLAVKDLKLSNQYRRAPDPHLKGVVYYFNKEGGVVISAGGLNEAEEKIVTITYEPVAADGHLRCPADPEAAANDPRPLFPAFVAKFDEFSELPVEDEKARLDNFAHALRQEPNSKGYVIFHGRRNAPGEEVEALVERVKRFLVDECGLSEARIITVVQGRREAATVELYVVPGGTPPSSAYP